MFGEAHFGWAELLLATASLYHVQVGSGASRHSPWEAQSSVTASQDERGIKGLIYECIRRQKAAAFLLNGVLLLLSNFKGLNMMHHIVSKLLSSHCNSSGTHRLSPLLQHGEVEIFQPILKTVGFLPVNFCPQMPRRLSNHCSKT